MHTPSAQSTQERLGNAVFLIEKLDEKKQFPSEQIRLGPVTTKFEDVFRWKTSHLACLHFFLNIAHS